jgi:nitroreductase
VDLYETIKLRKSVRKYRRDPVPEESLKKILNAARMAPTAENFQPWKIIVVTDEDIKRKLVPACNNQRFVAEAPVVLVACGLPDEAYPIMGGYMNSYPVDVAIVLDHLMLAAASEGLGTCWIGSFKEEKVAETVGVPQEAKVVALTPLGYPAEEMERTDRKNLTELVSYNKY